MMSKASVLFFQVLFNLLLITIVLIFIRKDYIDINFLAFFFFVILISLFDVFFLYRSGHTHIKKIIYFNLTRYFIFLLGYLIFYFLYYIPHNGIISVIAPAEYFDSGMYVYVAETIVRGIALVNTDFILYHGQHMSPNWMIIAYLYAGMFFIFGLESQILPILNLFLYSYLYFFFLFILGFSSLKYNTKYRIIFLMLLFPGPLYWTASLSKEIVNYLFLSLITVWIIKSEILNRKITIKLSVLTLLATIFSRFNIIAISFFGKYIFSKNMLSKKIFFIQVFKLYITIFGLFSIAVVFMDLVFDINYFNSPMYIPAGINAFEVFGPKMAFVPMSLVEMIYLLPFKFFLTVFDEVNFLHIFTYPYGSTDSYATLFNILQGIIRIYFIGILVLLFFRKKHIDELGLKILLFVLVYWLLFAISIGFFQSRYLIFGDYLLALSFFLIANRHKESLNAE